MTLIIFSLKILLIVLGIRSFWVSDRVLEQPGNKLEFLFTKNFWKFLSGNIPKYFKININDPKDSSPYFLKVVGCR